MKSFTATSPYFSPVEQYNVPLISNFREAEFCSEKYHTAVLSGLYFRDEHEPDFDCEFLPGINENFPERENIIESESVHYLPGSYAEHQCYSDI